MKLYFDTVDECIMAAYKHVKETKSKIEDYCNFAVGVKVEVGLKSSDQHFFLMDLNDNYLDAHKPLYHLIKSHNISTIDFINKQMMPFL